MTPRRCAGPAPRHSHVTRVGLGIDGEEGRQAGAGLKAFDDDDDAWDILADIPNDSAAALLLLEHHWAVPTTSKPHPDNTRRTARRVTRRRR